MNISIHTATHDFAPLTHRARTDRDYVKHVLN